MSSMRALLFSSTILVGICLRLSTGAAIPADNLILPHLNLTQLMDQIAADYHCSRDRTWIDGPERFDHKDCLGPIYKMQFEESAEDWKAEVPKEFVTRSGPRSGDLGLTLVTPRKYVVDSCSLVVIMRSDVRPADLPGDSGHSALVSDVSSFQRIAEKAYEVFTFCGKRQRLPGWALIGRNRGMAVALWATGSTVDRHYPDLRNLAIPAKTVATGPTA